MENAIYMKDSYVQEFEALVEDIKDDKYVFLSQTAFYPMGGGQPSDSGKLIAGSEEYLVLNATKSFGKISHEISKIGIKKGDIVVGKIDWEKRYRLMRMHTAAHIIDAVLYSKAGALCTGNQLGIEKSRIDFSLDVLDRDKMQEYINTANELARKAIDLKIYKMRREDALKIPGVVKLASVMPPEVEHLRIVEIPGIDLQADGGTQVKNTSEIGEIKFLSVENKGKTNRRLYYTLSS